MSESIQQLKHDLMLMKISRNAALSRRIEANKNWSKALKEWRIEKKKLLKELKTLKEQCTGCTNPIHKCTKELDVRN